MTVRHDGSHGPDCFGCRIKNVQLAASATPSRWRNMTARSDARKRDSNAWERGVARDHRGMPFLDRNLEPIGQKRASETRRARVDRRRYLASRR